MNITRVFPIFTAVFSIFYALAEPYDLQLFIYYPATDSFHATPQPMATFGPPINWYGWIAFGFVIAVVACAVALLLPRNWIEKYGPDLSWAAPVVAAIFLVCIARVWFI